VTPRRRELDSNFPYAGAMNLVFAPFVYRDNAKGTESLLTLRWREMDSNHRYPAEFFWLPPSIPPIHLRNINRLPRDRDRWFGSISLQR
jgi:hypothetical protein